MIDADDHYEIVRPGRGVGAAFLLAGCHMTLYALPSPEHVIEEVLTPLLPLPPAGLWAALSLILGASLGHIAVKFYDRRAAFSSIVAWGGVGGWLGAAAGWIATLILIHHGEVAGSVLQWATQGLVVWGAMGLGLAVYGLVIGWVTGLVLAVMRPAPDFIGIPTPKPLAPPPVMGETPSPPTPSSKTGLGPALTLVAGWMFLHGGWRVLRPVFRRWQLEGLFFFFLLAVGLAVGWAWLKRRLDTRPSSPDA